MVTVFKYEQAWCFMGVLTLTLSFLCKFFHRLLTVNSREKTEFEEKKLKSAAFFAQING